MAKVGLAKVGHSRSTVRSCIKKKATVRSFGWKKTVICLNVGDETTFIDAASSALSQFLLSL